MNQPRKSASKGAGALLGPSHRRAFPVLAGHVLVGALVATLLAFVDTIRAGVRDLAPRVSFGEVASAGVHLLAIYVAAGVVLGFALGAISRLILASRALRVAVSPILRAKRWVQPHPRFVAGAISGVVVALGLAASVAGLHMLFVARFHRPDLAGWTLGALVALIAAAMGVARPLIAQALLAPLKRAPRLATPAALGLVLLVVVVVVLVVGLTQFPALLIAYDPIALAWGPIALLLWALLSLALAPRIAAQDLGTVRGVATSVALLAFLGLIGSGLTYGSSNRVRTVVEQRSVLGRRALFLLTRLTDGDGDGYAWAWGGGDCNDADRNVHPGSLDPAGDGVDQDCFAGDGAPIIVERTLGEFGTRRGALGAHPNLLVITVDALRRDHLGANGYERPVSPRMDAFIEESVQFTQVVPQASRSLRSIPSMWNGQYPSETGFGPEYLWPALLEENVMAPELLSDAGYATSVVMGTDYFRRVDGFFQGFDHIDQIELYDPPRGMAVDHALPELTRLAADDAPWLLWVHLFNVHAPYLQDGVPSRFGEEQLDYYDTEIGFADREVGRLLDALTDTGQRERTVVVLASDHGEAFQEHGQWGHCTTLYEEELASVLAIRVPGIAPSRVEAPVALLDVAPTLLEAASVVPSQQMSGLSLLPFMTGERTPDPERPIFAELIPDGMFPYDMKSIRRGDRKLIWWASEGTVQYFDLAADPLELDDLSDARPSEVAPLLHDLRAWVATAATPENRSDTFVARHRLPGPPPTLTHRTDIHFPGFTVLGFDFPEDEFAPGDHIPLTFYYEVEGAVEGDLFFLVKIEGPTGYRVPPHFHAWHYPLSSRYRTTEWQPGEFLEDPTPIVVPPDIEEPVDLRLTLSIRDQSGTYQLGERDGERLFEFELARFRVRSVPAAPGVVSPL